MPEKHRFEQLLLEQNFGRLFALDKKEILLLKNHSQEEIFHDSKKYVCSVWKDDLNEGVIRVVVQIYQPKILGFGFMSAKGFWIDNEGDKTLLSSGELSEFV